MKPLTPREKQIAEMVARGYANKRIAHELGIALTTVEKHLQQAAQRIEGDTAPRHKMLVWFYSLSESDAA
jgi:DNA-binding NarL/FixJ family response regulator